MKRMSDVDSNNFYYLAGCVLANYYGDVPLEFRKKVVSKFKEWVDFKNGSNVLPTNRSSVESIVKSFLYEFNKGESRGRQRH